MTVQDVRTTFNVVGRRVDGSDETLSSKKLHEKAVLKCIEKFEAMETVHLKIALTKKGETAQFPFFGAWTLPSTVFHRSSGSLGLKNIKFVVV